MSKINKTGYKGVNFQESAKSKPYIATINVAQKEGKFAKIYVGHYKTPELAYIARLQFLDKLK